MDPLGPLDPFDAPQPHLSDRLDDLIVWFERRRSAVPRLGLVVATLALVGVGGWWAMRARAITSIEDHIPMVTLDQVASGPVDDSTTEDADAFDPGADSDDESAEPALVVVHVAGAVASPGVFVLAADSRVIDAVDAAGGASAGADLSLVNLAAPLIDGSQIRIPLVGETVVAPLVPMGGAPDGGTGDQPIQVDLNRATATELETLTGVGPATAAAIITWRSNNGSFVTAEQLLDVPGIGPAKFAALADQVVVR